MHIVCFENSLEVLHNLYIGRPKLSLPAVLDRDQRRLFQFSFAIMKVLENSLINLDVIPGKAQIDLQKKLRDQGQSAVNDAGQFTK